MARGKNIGSLRNLAQFREKTDEEILEIVGTLETEGTGELSSQVQAQIDALEKDYDFTDMKYNDMVLIWSMAMLMVRLAQSEPALEERIRSGDIESHNALKEEQRLKTMRDAIRDLQNDLGILRVKRVEKIEDNPLLLFDDVRKRAKHFLKERLIYVRCPECQIAICTVNFLYPEQSNQLSLKCGKCGKSHAWSSSELLAIEKDNPFK